MGHGCGSCHHYRRSVPSAQACAYLNNNTRKRKESCVRQVGLLDPGSGYESSLGFRNRLRRRHAHKSTMFDSTHSHPGHSRETFPAHCLPGHLKLHPHYRHHRFSPYAHGMTYAENKDSTTVILDVPGVEEDGIALWFEKDTESSMHVLVVAAARLVKKSSEFIKCEGTETIEPSFSNFEKRILLPGDSIVEEYASTHSNGVLTITVPRRSDFQHFEFREAHPSGC